MNSLEYFMKLSKEKQKELIKMIYETIRELQKNEDTPINLMIKNLEKKED